MGPDVTAAAFAGRGTFEVVRGRSAGARLLAAMLRLPRAGRAVPVTLTITRAGTHETWRRDFGGRAVVTRQHMAGDRLVERAGPLVLEYRGSVRDGALHLSLVRCRLLGVPVPRRLAPRVDCGVRDDGASLDVSVAVALPRGRLLLRYGGPLLVEGR